MGYFYGAHVWTYQEIITAPHPILFRSIHRYLFGSHVCIRNAIRVGVHRRYDRKRD